jgi:hypothetical protein
MAFSLLRRLFGPQPDAPAPDPHTPDAGDDSLDVLDDDTADDHVKGGRAQTGGGRLWHEMPDRDWSFIN